MLQASGISKAVTWSMTEDEARFVLLLMRQKQDDCMKITSEYPPSIYRKSSELDVRIEQLKMKLAGQL